MLCGASRLILAPHICATSMSANILRTIRTYSFVQQCSLLCATQTGSSNPTITQILKSRTTSRCCRPVRNFSVTSVPMFWEKEKKGGYSSKEKTSSMQLIRNGFKELGGELLKLKEEWKEKLECDPLHVRPGDMDKVWVFENQEDLDKWVVTSDRDHKEGFSTGSLTISPTGHGLFSGELDAKVPKTGNVKKAGYVNMRSLQPRISFKREVYLDWTMYNTLEIRARGDGRSYLVNISTSGYFDYSWNDMYSYVLYTRGGPHWQTSRIPFSKFFLSSKGRVQDKQIEIPLDQVVCIGISAGDRIDAPFRLEIDYIGVFSDPDHDEKFAYEMYQLPKYYIGS